MTIIISVAGTLLDLLVIGLLSFLLKNPYKIINLFGMIITIGSIGTALFAILTLSALELEKPPED
jgi:hypothetical protein